MLIYDIEIINMVPEADGVREAGIRYCEGWDDFRGMGIACACCYDMVENTYRVFTDGNLSQLQHLIDRHDVLVGWNNHAFDDKVLEANGIWATATYDLRAEVMKAHGYSPNERIKGVSLAKIATANGFGTKRMSGAMAPILWQRGDFGSVIDYCLHDVYLTMRLMARVLREGVLTSPKPHGRTLSIPRPFSTQPETA